MKFLSSIARAMLLACVSFAAGWLVHEHETAPKLQRITEERDLTLKMAEASLAMSAKAIDHSLSNAETLAICLEKIGLRPVEAPPRKIVTTSRAGLA